MTLKKDIYIPLEEKLRHKLLLLPDYAADFIESLENTREIRTRIEYCKDLLIFLDFLRVSKGIEDIPISILNSLTPKDIRDFLGYLTEYKRTFASNTNKTIVRTFSNSASSKERKLASIHELFQSLFNDGLIESNVTAKVAITTKKHVKMKDMLTPEELKYLFQVILDEENILSKREKAFAKRLKYRDYAICSLLAYTGIRIGELVQLDLNDVSIANEAIIVTRKGGDEEKIPLPDEIIGDVGEFLKQRKEMDTLETAMFLSMQHKRINSRTVNNLLLKYGERSGFEMNLTPHVFRRTFGTKHYNTYGDISLTGTLLGHKSTETTKKFYAKISDKRVRQSMKEFSYGKENESGGKDEDKDKLKTFLEKSGLTYEDIVEMMKDMPK